jgi:hypothetical protein
MNSSFVEPYATDLDAAVQDYEEWLDKCESATQLKQVIQLDKEMILPVPLAVDTYEKYLKINRNDAEILKNYADYIDLLIPDWSDYAKKLEIEAAKIRNRS